MEKRTHFRQLTIRKIALDRTGDTSEQGDLALMRDFSWDGRREIVLVDQEQVMSFEDLLKALERSPHEYPEVILLPPLCGGL